MNRHLGCSAVLALLAGCASNVPDPAADARDDLAAATASAASATPAAPAAEPVVVEVEDFNYRIMCEDIVKPGSRIVIGERCTPLSESGSRQARETEQMRLDTEAVLREHDQITRAARERDLEAQLPVLMRR
jgi:hypothetical protein